MEEIGSYGMVVWRSDINSDDAQSAIITKIGVGTSRSVTVFSDGSLGGRPQTNVVHMDSERSRQNKVPDGVWCTLDEDVSHRRKKAALARQHQEEAEKRHAEKIADRKKQSLTDEKKATARV